MSVLKWFISRMACQQRHNDAKRQLFRQARNQEPAVRSREALAEAIGAAMPAITPVDARVFSSIVDTGHWASRFDYRCSLLRASGSPPRWYFILASGGVSCWVMREPRSVEAFSATSSYSAGLVRSRGSPGWRLRTSPLRWRFWVSR